MHQPDLLLIYKVKSIINILLLIDGYIQSNNYTIQLRQLNITMKLVEVAFILSDLLSNIYDRKLGNNTTFQGIKEAGHLVQLERPFVYNRCLKQFLSSVMPSAKK